MPVELPLQSGRATPMLHADRIVIPFSQVEDGSMVFETDNNLGYVFLKPSTWQAWAAGGAPATYWAGAINNVPLASILASTPIIWAELENIGGFILSVDGTTLTIPFPGLFVVVLHISENTNSDGVMIASISGNGFEGGRSAALISLTGDDFAEGETTMFTHGWAGGPAALTVDPGFGSLVPTTGSFAAHLIVYQVT